MMAWGLWLNPQPRRLHSPGLPHQESCTDCCFSPPSLLMDALHCEWPLALWRASCIIVSLNAGELAVLPLGYEQLLWDLLNGTTWKSTWAPKYHNRTEECGWTAAELVCCSSNVSCKMKSCSIKLYDNVPKVTSVMFGHCRNSLGF